MRKLYTLFFLLLLATLRLNAAHATNLAFGPEELVSNSLSDHSIQNSFIAMSKGEDVGIAVWESLQNITGKQQVWVNFFNTTSGWGAPTLITTYNDTSALGIGATPQAALNDAGQGYLTYARNSSGASVVVIPVDATSATPLGPSIPFPAANETLLPYISVGNDGDAVVAWFEYDSGANTQQAFAAATIDASFEVAVTGPITSTTSPLTVEGIFDGPRTKTFGIDGVDQGLIVFC